MVFTPFNVFTLLYLLYFIPAAYKDFKENKINAKGFYFLKGLAYAGIYFDPTRTILIAVLVGVMYFVFGRYQEFFFGSKALEQGDFTMLVPFSLYNYLFGDVVLFVFSHLMLLVFSVIYFRFISNKGYAPVLLLAFIFSVISVILIGV